MLAAATDAKLDNDIGNPKRKPENSKMKYAKVDNLKTLASPKKRGICFCCEKEVIAKCGSIKVWHWSHYPERHCDNWWENETEWHRMWKSYFDKEFQETILIDDETGEKHIADIKNKEGLIIELQNSSISEQEFNSREKFYKNLIWVVNGNKFKNQFTIFPYKLPPPNSILANDLSILREPELIDDNHIEKNTINDLFVHKFRKPIIHKKSKSECKTSIFTIRDKNGNDVKFSVNSTLYESFSITKNGVTNPQDEIDKEINEIYEGHLFFYWKNKRNIWYKSTTKVFIDFDGSFIIELCKFDDKINCIKLIHKDIFIKSIGGNIVG